MIQNTQVANSISLHTSVCSNSSTGNIDLFALENCQLMVMDTSVSACYLFRSE